MTFEVIFHGRGGQGALSAARILANAFFFDGKYVEAFPYFGAERRGAPVKAFLRADDKPIRSKVPITAADCAIIMDSTLHEFVDITESLKENSLILINTPLKPEEIKLKARYKLAACDASEISRRIIGKNIPNSAMLGAFSRAAALPMEALAKAFKEVFVDGAKAAKNIEMAKIAADATIIGSSGVETEFKPIKTADISGLKIEIGGTFKANGSSRRNATSSWTTLKAVLDPDKCSSCMLCCVLCPEGCILKEEKKLKIDEDFCKGCGICEQVCPRDAIQMQRKDI